MTSVKPIYKEDIQSVSNLLDSSIDKGLTEDTSHQRLLRDGTNSIKKSNPNSLWRRFFEQFTNLLVVLLIVAAGLSFYLGSYRDALVLCAIVLANASIGFYQDWKSENVLSSIGHLLVEKCIVIRDSIRKEIPVTQLVKGDLVYYLKAMASLLTFG